MQAPRPGTICSIPVQERPGDAHVRHRRRNALSLVKVMGRAEAFTEELHANIRCQPHEERRGQRHAGRDRPCAFEDISA